MQVDEDKDGESQQLSEKKFIALPNRIIWNCRDSYRKQNSANKFWMCNFVLIFEYNSKNMSWF